MKDRKLLMIPGPIEFEPSVLAAMGAPTTSHLAPEFIEAFGQALERLREVFLSTDGQPFALAGSGTFAMDVAGANLIEPGDRALVVNTGYFGNRYTDLLGRYGAQVDQVFAPPGGRPTLDQVAQALEQADYKLVTVTHVDTSTGVLADVHGIADLIHARGGHHPLLVVDGVCSVAGEELRMSSWGVDVAFTASQKAIGVPPGLALIVAGPRALEAHRNRKTPVANYYADWANWLPVMQAYEARKTAYFGTPPVNLIFALNTSLEIILKEGMEKRFARHRMVSRSVKDGIKALGLGQVPTEPDFAAHTMTAPRYPEDVQGAEFLSRVGQAGVILAGGLLPAIKNEYFRIGHMGSVNQADVLATIGAIELALKESGYDFDLGSGVQAAQQAWIVTSKTEVLV